MGYKWLYGQMFDAKEEFWRIYPRSEYDTLRAKYRATNLPTTYDKVRTEVKTERDTEIGGWKIVWPFEAVMTFFCAITGFGRRG